MSRLEGLFRSLSVAICVTDSATGKHGGLPKSSRALISISGTKPDPGGGADAVVRRRRIAGGRSAPLLRSRASGVSARAPRLHPALRAKLAATAAPHRLTADLDGPCRGLQSARDELAGARIG